VRGLFTRALARLLVVAVAAGAAVVLDAGASHAAAPPVVQFETSGLPATTSVSVAWSGTAHNNAAINGTATFGAPGPSAATPALKSGATFSYSAPSQVAGANGNAYFLASSTPASGATISSDTTVVLTYVEAHHVRFGTAGLPTGAALTVAYSATPPGSGTFTFTSPGPSSGAVDVRAGTSFGFTPPASVSAGGDTYAFSSAVPEGPFTAGAAGATTTVTLTYTLSCQAPGITSQPEHAFVHVGEPATFTVAATGTEPLTYQWYKEGEPITDATDSTLSIPSAAVGDTAFYTVRVANGCSTATSDPAALVVSRWQPVIAWSEPDPIEYGTAIDAAHLAATASDPITGDPVPGTFAYTYDETDLAALGAVLGGGAHTLEAEFTPDDTDRYSAASAQVALAVMPRPLTVTADDKGRTYGDPDPSFTASFDGFVAGDGPADLDGDLVCTTTATAASAVGDYPIDCSASTLASPDYTLIYVPGIFTVGRRALTVTPDAASRTYGAPNPAFAVGYSGFANGDGPEVLSGHLVCDTVATTASPAGQYAIDCSGSTLSAADYDVYYVDGYLTVDPAPLTVTADDASRVYGDPDPEFTVSYSGFVNGDDEASLAGGLDCSSPATTWSSAGGYEIDCSASTLGSPNYEITYVAGTLTVTPARLTVTADDASRAYGDPDPEFTVSYSGFVDGDDEASLTGDVACSTSATSGSLVGEYEIDCSASTLGSPNYEITYVAGTLTVTPAPLTVTADDASRAYGSADPEFTVSYAGLVNGDDEASLTGDVDCSSEAITWSPVGDYAIDCSASTLASPNYQIAYSPGTLTVVPARLSVTADDQARPYGDPNPALTASFSGFAPGEGPADLDGDLDCSTPATPSSPVGEYEIDCSASTFTSPNYAVEFVAGTLHVVKTVLTVTAVNATRVYGEPDPAFTATVDGFVGTDDESVLGGTLVCSGPPVGAAVGTHPITCTGLTSPDYAFDYVAGTLTVTPTELRVAADSTTRAYGAPNPTFTVSYDGFAADDGPADLDGEIVCTTPADESAEPGVYPIDCSTSTLASPNYEIVFEAGVLHVVPAALTVRADDHERPYGAANPALAATATGFAPGESLADLDGVISCTTGATEASLPGEYVVDCSASTLASDHYDVEYEPGTLTITRAPLAVTAADRTAQYSDPVSLTATFDGFVNDDDSDSLAGELECTTTAVIAAGAVRSRAGTYPITCGGVTSPAYAITFVPGTLTVTREDATVTYSGATVARAGRKLALRATFLDSAARPYAGARAETAGRTVGDITRAVVRFDVFGRRCGKGTPESVTARVVDTGPTGDGIGTATARFAAPAGGRCVVARIDPGNRFYVGPAAAGVPVAHYAIAGVRLAGAGRLSDGKGTFDLRVRRTSDGLRGPARFSYAAPYKGEAARVEIAFRPSEFARLGSAAGTVGVLEGAATITISRTRPGLDPVRAFRTTKATFRIIAVDSGRARGEGDTLLIEVWDARGIPFVRRAGATTGDLAVV
jgi:hypothetical protein